MNNSTFDSTLDFFVSFPTHTNVTIHVTNTDIGFKSSSLTSGGLFLDWFKLHDFFFEIFFEEEINDFEFYIQKGY